jgi:hypothetical protein
MSCVAFAYGARQRSLLSKNALCALCLAPGQNPHGKGCAVRVLASAVRLWHTAKHANPVLPQYKMSQRCRQSFQCKEVGEM